jgi:electron transfer flavoprotein beta subunit
MGDFMNIVVCIKQVPDTTEIRLDPIKGTLIRDGVPSIINPDDKAGLEEALKLKDLHGAHITAITMGPPQAEQVLKEAFAMGVDKGILLTDRKFAGADSLATSNALAGALRKLDFDVVITGRQAIDGDTAQVGPQLAEHLGLPQMSYVKEMNIAGENLIRVKRGVEDGYQVLEAETPCVLTILSEANNPRYMSVSKIIEAVREKKIEVWDTSMIDIDLEVLGLSGSPTKVKKSFTKGAKTAGKIHEVSPQEAVTIIVDKLKENFII